MLNEDIFLDCSSSRSLSTVFSTYLTITSSITRLRPSTSLECKDSMTRLLTFAFISGARFSHPIRYSSVTVNVFLPIRQDSGKAPGRIASSPEYRDCIVKWNTFPIMEASNDSATSSSALSRFTT